MNCKRNRFGALVVFLAVAVSAGVTATAQNAGTPDTPVDFARDIKPVFQQSCIRCHGPGEENGDFRVDDRDSVMNYVDPGEGEFSQLVELVSTDDDSILMPPPGEEEPLTDEQVDLIRRWIDEGAVWPDGVTVEMPSPEVEQAIETQVEQRQIAADQQKGSWELVWDIIGLLHPAMVHFPAGLLIGGALFALVGMRSESPLSDAAYYCLWLGAWTAILACVSGWSFGAEKGYNDWQRLEFDKSIDIHRWGGILVAVLSFLLALFACASRRRDPYGTGFVWKTGLILLACLTGWIAHHGGKMVHTGLHDKLIRKSELLYSGLTGPDQANRPEDPPNPDTASQPDPDPPDPDGPDAEATEDDGNRPADEGNAATSDDD